MLLCVVKACAEHGDLEAVMLLCGVGDIGGLGLGLGIVLELAV